VSLVEHARTELQRSGDFDRDPIKATVVMALISVVDAFVSTGEISAVELVDPLSVLLHHSTLTPLSDDPGEWADRSSRTGKHLWQSRRNPNAFSHNGGASYFLLAEKQQYSPAEPPTYPSTHVRGPRVRAVPDPPTEQEG
jgi:hypothetical protein